MRDGHPGARGRERGCGAARSVGRPYSGPTALKQLVWLPGMVAWQCAQTRRGVGLCGCHSSPPAQLQPACGSGRVAARGKSPPPNAATRPLQVPHLLMSVHASCIKTTRWKTRALVSVSLPPVPLCKWDFQPRSGGPQLVPPILARCKLPAAGTALPGAGVTGVCRTAVVGLWACWEGFLLNFTAYAQIGYGGFHLCICFQLR